MAPTLDEATERLYAAELDAFVDERKRLARELREAGRRDEATALGRLRKPTTAAWALNQLARRRRRDVDLLLDAGHRLREAQAGLLQGRKRDEFARARRAQEEAVRRLVRDAEELLGEGASPAALRQVGEALRAAAVSDEARELLALGRFVRPPSPDGFGALAELAPAKPSPRPEDTEERRRAEAALREALADLRAAEKAARAARRRAERLRGEAEEAEREARAAAEREDAARRAVERAEEELP